MKGPESFLNRLSVSVPSVVDPSSSALLEPSMRIVVNGHFFWVATAEELTALRAAPHRYTGRLLDPATHEWFDPTEQSPRVDLPGGILLFSSPDSLRLFEEAGASYSGHVH